MSYELSIQGRIIKVSWVMRFSKKRKNNEGVQNLKTLRSRKTHDLSKLRGI